MQRKKQTDAMEVVVLCLWSFALLLSGASATGVVVRGRGGGRGNVTYDGRSLIINGERRIIFSGSIHYPRSTPQMWPSLIAKAKAGGLDAIDTYVFWNIHEPQPGKFDFSGRNDLVRFIKEVQAQGLHVCLRIGPFIQGEWTYGGLPFWLHDVPGIVFRSDNKPFQFHMKKYVRKIVKMMKAKKLYASQGGPIILSQIENEYGTVEAEFGKKGPSYVRWAAKMAVRLHTGVPWVMCKQNDAPDPVINTCNGMRCGQTFSGPNSPNKPALWTENWTTYYQVYGEEPRLRSAEDIAFHVALFIAKGGSYVNYYMYHGGTNFGRTASPYVLTAYYDQAPLDEYGLLRQPKWGHLKELHAAIKSGTKPLLYGEHKNMSLGRLQQAYVFRGNPGECAAFIINYDGRENAVIDFENSKYYLPPHSISILQDCKTVVFNTAQVSTQYGTRSASTSLKFDSINQWQEYKEAIPTFAEASFRANTLLEQMNVTKDSTDYLWYTFRFQHHSSEARAVLTVNSRAHKLLVFVNGVFAGSVHGSPPNREFTLQRAVSLRRGKNRVSLLSAMVGLPDSGPYLERRVAGLRRVRIQCGKELKDFTNAEWGYKVGLLGEKTQVYTESGSKQVEWSKFRSSTLEPLKWYKTQFDAPEGKDPVALNLGSMGKGAVWVNGQSIGRYWVSFLTPKGHPSQTWYNVPRSFLKPKGNLLVLLEEEGGNPLGISIDSISTSKVCSRVSDSYPPPMSSWRSQQQRHSKGAKLRLHCSPGKNISRILFSSFGTPSGDCQNYATGSCHSSNSTSIVEKVCLGKRKCSIPVSSQKFGADPCPGIPKSLLVDATCA